jgi:hypothetical protein
MFDMEEEKKE